MRTLMLPHDLRGMQEKQGYQQVEKQMNDEYFAPSSKTEDFYSYRQHYG